MKAVVSAVLVGLLYLLPSMAKDASPIVQVYSREPGEFGKPNTLICHVSGFHPPEITIELLKDGKEIPGGKQTDLAFEENWHYHLTKHVRFTPIKGEQFSCKVTHMGKIRNFEWESDM
ncbi:beta-2-microglobulin-like [Epinephelus fuscoguttatus]|uniref:beta-2-microglobulin-like n=1 Tax=Epinephelus fuscoguttatus TaxID=293821 RepID=UPI0020D09EC5|nr:beta-2-microglobulin-like [Epinephelus fuscoguttatus]